MWNSPEWTKSRQTDKKFRVSLTWRSNDWQVSNKQSLQTWCLLSDISAHKQHLWLCCHSQTQTASLNWINRERFYSDRLMRSPCNRYFLPSSAVGIVKINDALQRSIRSYVFLLVADYLLQREDLLTDSENGWEREKITAVVEGYFLRVAPDFEWGVKFQLADLVPDGIRLQIISFLMRSDPSIESR